ncbi:hypothetical protein GOP47_0013122 [Adiantum capillus-veneris]|uniref:Uncharacterized protein n=1 Tax=Adiantum capillus-veneris TaxID=13818 RepID=A0A9D4ZHG3_ADICA|nr:hypothetical protein GOP47_0012867 [Adiantum capillus-veneris]KAI5073016.1 hypothetical protein GOP47_0013122 [Adiantum capillus-veneris]
MAANTPPLAAWPWQWAETYKYLLYFPLGVQVINKYYHGESILNDTFFHILLLSLLRCGVYQMWHIVSRSHFFFRTRRIQREQVEFEQVDREFDWDNHVILQALIAAISAQVWAPGFVRGLPLFNLKGAPLLMLLHVGPAELLYYCFHRAFHSNKYLNREYHYLHHLSTRPEPSTAGTATFLEHLLLTVVMALPLGGAIASGHASVGLLYAYVLGFDFIRYMIHSNVEVMPLWPFEQLPLLRYLLITPSYHSLHHMQEYGNYCLYVPFYDYLGGTLNPSSFKLHEEMRRIGKEVLVPDSVFVPHGVDLVSALHIGLLGRTYASNPRDGVRWDAQLWTPFVFIGLWISWFWGKAYTVAEYSLHGVIQQTWTVPFIGFQYFLPNAFVKINKTLEETILEADRMGVKVITLGALNKNEAMNGGGLLFVKKLKNLKVRVCHGNTLTTAVILHELPENVSEVFLTGSTSKIGKAIALYLCRKHVRVLMLTASQERFDAVVNEAPKDCQQYLVRATKYQAGQNCKTWIIGKWAGLAAQKLAPPGTRFHQFTLPPILHFRRDCFYNDSVGIRLPEKLVHGVNSCEHTMPRHVVYACHAGGLVHALEGWEHHEVGPVDVDRLDVVWEAAMRHGLAQV